MANLVPGIVVEHYLLKDKIGEGGMGFVFTAEEPSMRRQVAIKFLADFAQDQDAQRRFEREALMIARLEHPHILPVYSFGQYEETPYIVMRYMVGGTLSDRLKAGTMSVDQIIYCLGQVADALDYAHERGIIHRDLKPANVFFDERNNAYLADFGLAKTISGSHDLTKTDEGITGTPDYMSPEQVRGMRLDGRTDIYALGVIAYQALTGRTPFAGKNPMEIVLQHLSGHIPRAHEIAPYLPEAVDGVFQKVLAKDPQERHPLASGFVRDLRHALGDIQGALRPVEIDIAHGGGASDRIKAMGGAGREITVPAGTVERTQVVNPVRDIHAPETAPGRPGATGKRAQLAGRPDRQSGRFGWIAAILVVLLAALAFGYWFSRDPLAALPQIRYPIDKGPRSLLHDTNGHIWVVSYEANSANILNARCGSPVTCGSLIQNIALSQRPVSIVQGDNQIFIGHQLDTKILRFALDGSPLMPIEIFSTVNQLHWANRQLWASLADSLVQFTPDGREIARYAPGDFPTNMVSDGDHLWVVSERDSRITRIDMRGQVIDGDIPIPSQIGELVDLAIGQGFLWVTLSRQGKLLKVDPASGELLATYAAGSQPLAVAAASGVIWIADHAGGQVLALDPADGTQIGSLPLDGEPSDLALIPCGDTCRDLWVAVELNDALVRVRLEDISRLAPPGSFDQR